ncbi:MAG TPA: OmpA family protein [Thermoanaerobaculia bacterium]|nr:OmpA family protein [Thermoanaerobaculia bacterium]
MRRSILTLALFLAAAPAVFGLQGFPAYVTLPPGVILYDPGSLTVEDVAEVEFPLGEGKTVTQRGKHYRSYLKFGPDEENRPVDRTWKEWQPALAASGWVVKGNDGGTGFTLVRKVGTAESWLAVRLGDYQSPVIDLIEKQGAVAALILQAPKPQAEKIGPKDDFPYFGKPAGAVLDTTSNVAEPLDVTVGGVDRETVLVGLGHVVKYYTPPASLSRFEFESTYRDALAKAGWTVKPLMPGTKLGEGQSVVAHYAANGRNLWLVAGRGADNSNTGLIVKVADLGAEDWGKRLDTGCRLTLSGVTFDFNKDTLRPDSIALLEKAKDVLAARPTLQVEVQGHTDNVGGDDANQKLSAARAEAVRKWLAAHGIEAGRLTAKGYGKTSPIADNKTDAGRAKNRRVDLVRVGCKG